MGGRRCQNFYRFQKVTKEGKGFGADALGHTGTLCGGACCQNFVNKSKKSEKNTSKAKEKYGIFKNRGNMSKNGKWLKKYRLVSPKTYTRLCKGGTYRKFFNIDKSDRRWKNNTSKWRKYVRSEKLSQNRRGICKKNVNETCKDKSWKNGNENGIRVSKVERSKGRKVSRSNKSRKIDVTESKKKLQARGTYRKFLKSKGRKRKSRERIKGF